MTDTVAPAQAGAALLSGDALDDAAAPAFAGATGVLASIARQGRPKGPMETIDHVEVTLDGGLHGDFRGTIKPGGKGRRQVTLLEGRRLGRRDGRGRA